MVQPAKAKSETCAIHIQIGLVLISPLSPPFHFRSTLLRQMRWLAVTESFHSSITILFNIETDGFRSIRSISKQKYNIVSVSKKEDIRYHYFYIETDGSPSIHFKTEILHCFCF